MSDHDRTPEAALENVLATLGATDAVAPPADLRGRILAGIATRPRRDEPELHPRDLYRSRCAAMREILDELGPRDWTAPAAPYTWSVHGLVAHLLQIERYTAAVLGAAPPWPGDEPDHLATGAASIVTELGRDPRSTLEDWTAAVAVVDAHVAAEGLAPDIPAPLHGWPFSRSSALVARAFEIWTHADDVCRAVGRTPTTPHAGELRTMSRLSVRAVPFLLARDRPAGSVGAVRIVLTGEGGGTFDLGEPEAGRRALLVADVVDYCRVVARRIAPADLAAVREGDTALLDDLLVAAGAFAV